MLKKILSLSLLLAAGHLLLGTMLLVIESTCGIGDTGFSRSLAKLFGLANIATIIILSHLDLFTDSVLVNIVLLMLVGIPQWIIVAFICTAADDLSLWVRVRVENSLPAESDRYADMLKRLNGYNRN